MKAGVFDGNQIKLIDIPKPQLIREDYILVEIKKSFENNKAKCYDQMDLVFNEINDSFSNAEIKKGKEKAHAADNTGKSLVKTYNLKLANGSIRITCTDWSGDFKDSNGRILKDNFKITIASELLLDWLKNEAY